MFRLRFIVSSILVVLFCAQIPFPSFAQQTDSTQKLLSALPHPFPPAQWQRPRTLDVKHIALNLRFDWQKKQAYGTAALTLASMSASRTIALDARLLSISAVTLPNGKNLTFDYNSNDSLKAAENLVITLDRTYQAGETLTLTVAYRTNWQNRTQTDPANLGGSTGKGIRFFEPGSVEPQRRRQIWSMAGFGSAAYWFPCHDVPNDLRTGELTATAEKPLTAVANGVLASTRTNTDGTRSFTWRMNTPMANYQTAFVVGEYVDIAQKQGNIELHSFAYPDEVQAATATIERLPAMMKFFQEKTGMPFAQKSYTQVFVQDLPWGMESVGVGVATENMVDDFGTHADFLYLWDGLEAESLARQWFGGRITPRSWADFWLTRGFARYFDGLFCEHSNGRAEYLLYNHSTWDMGFYLADWNGGNRRPLHTTHYNDAADYTTDNHSYFRSALVLHLLRTELGEDKWWRGIRHYLKTYDGKTVSTEHFRTAMEESTGAALDWFFDQWVYKMGHPVFVVSKNYDAGKKQLTLTVKQVQKQDSSSAYPQNEYFRGSVDVEIDGRIERVFLEAKVENTFTFASAEPPCIVHFDYEGAWIKEMTFAKPLDELLYQFQNDKDIIARRWAMLECVKLAKSDKTSLQDKERMYAAFRAVCLGDSYWRLKYLALLQLQNLLAPGTTAAASPSMPPVEKASVVFDEATLSMLRTFIAKETSWNRTAAINMLGMTHNAAYADLYLSHLNDKSDRVVNAAANALGKSKHPQAFDALVKLKDKPSWKNQSLISSLNGLKELGDPRGAEIALKALSDLTSPRWTLAVPVWDFRIAAAETLVGLRKADIGYPVVAERIEKSLAENDMNALFNNILLLTTLADPRGQQLFDRVRTKLASDAVSVSALEQFETQFKEAIKNP
jgi:aminopeptidase N